MNLQLFTYSAIVTDVYDGDTCTVNIDLGLHTWIQGEKIRFNRINTPEVKGDERTDGLKVRDYVRELILNKKIILNTIKDKKGKYGRYLGEIWTEDENGEFFNLNDHLVTKGFAVYKEY